MVKFTDEDKEEFNNTYFEQGVHKVKIGKIEFDKTQDNREFAEFTLIGEGGEEDSVRVWFHTPGARKYSFNTIRSIFVHNAPKAKKDEVRKKFDALPDTEELDKACQKMIVGQECWFSVYEDPNRTYTVEATGEIKNSYKKNIYGFEPDPQYVKPSKVLDGNGEDGGKDVKIEDTDHTVDTGEEEDQGSNVGF